MRTRIPKDYDEASLYDYAIGALGRRMRSVAELKRLMRRKVAHQGELGEALIDLIIFRLKEKKYLNDAQYASAFSSYRRDNEKFGRYRVISDLKSRGVHGDIIEQAAVQCGWKPERLLNRGGSLHLLLIDNLLAAQLSIEPGPTCRIDSPPLYLSMGERDTFLSHLYTWPAFRRRGAAQRLVAATVSSLSGRSVQRIVAHVRATNVPSLAAFERAGWKGGATVICTLKGQLLLATGAARAGFSFRSAT